MGHLDEVIYVLCSHAMGNAFGVHKTGISRFNGYIISSDRLYRSLIEKTSLRECLCGRQSLTENQVTLAGNHSTLPDLSQPSNFYSWLGCPGATLDEGKVNTEKKEDEENG